MILCFGSYWDALMEKKASLQNREDFRGGYDRTTSLVMDFIHESLYDSPVNQRFFIGDFIDHGLTPFPTRNPRRATGGAIGCGNSDVHNSRGLAPRDPIKGASGAHRRLPICIPYRITRAVARSDTPLRFASAACDPPVVPLEVIVTKPKPVRSRRKASETPGERLKAEILSAYDLNPAELPDANCDAGSTLARAERVLDAMATLREAGFDLWLVPPDTSVRIRRKSWFRCWWRDLERKEQSNG